MADYAKKLRSMRETVEQSDSGMTRSDETKERLKNLDARIKQSESAGASRGKQGGPTADELRAERYRKYQDAMNAEYESRAKMLGKTKDQYVKDQAAKENEALKKAPISDFMTDSGMKKGGITASSRADGIAQRGKTRGKLIMCGGGRVKK